jgi:hypothetical protein
MRGNKTSFQLTKLTYPLGAYKVKKYYIFGMSLFIIVVMMVLRQETVQAGTSVKTPISTTTVIAAYPVPNQAKSVQSLAAQAYIAPIASSPKQVTGSGILGPNTNPVLFSDVILSDGQYLKYKTVNAATGAWGIAKIYFYDLGSSNAKFRVFTTTDNVFWDFFEDFYMIGSINAVRAETCQYSQIIIGTYQNNLYAYFHSDPENVCIKNRLYDLFIAHIISNSIGAMSK